MKLIKSDSFKKSLISYILILVLPFIVSGLVYNRAIEIMQNNYIQFSSNSLNYAKDLIEKEFSYIDKYILELSTKPELRKIINLGNPPEGSPDMYWFYEFYRFYNNTNFDNIRNNNRIFLLINKNKTVFSKTYANFNFKDFYYNYFFYDDLNFEEWYSMYFGKYYYRDYISEKPITINGIKGNYITLLYTLPIANDTNYSGKKEAVIAYLFDADELKKMLQTTIAQSGGWAYIVDKNNQILVSTDTTGQMGSVDIEDIHDGHIFTSINGEEVLAVYTKLSNISWRFVSLIPVANIKAGLNQFRCISLGVLSIAILIGLTTSVFLSYKNTKPITGLVNLLSNAITEKDVSCSEIIRLQNGIKEIINDNNKIKKSMLSQHKYLRILYFEKLFRGDFENVRDLEIALKHLNLDFQGEYYIVVLIRINSMDQLVNDAILKEQDLFRVVLDKILLDASYNKGYTHILNQNELALLLSFEDNKQYENRLRGIMDLVNEAFQSNFTIKPIFSVGNLYSNLLDIHLSLKEARYAADYMIYNNMKDTIIWYKNLDHKYTRYYYTNEIEQRIVNHTKMGDWDELKSLFSALYINTISNKNMSGQMKWILLNDVCATMIKLSMDLEINIDTESLDKVVNSKDLEQYYNTLKSQYKQICNTISQNKKSHNEQLKENILKYIHENFTDSNLCVANLSKKFNLSEGYFSQFFKEQTGKTFSRYLESLRMERASALLINTDLTIYQIAQHSGYNNVSTFRRAFKRIKAVSPTEYIKANK